MGNTSFLCIFLAVLPNWNVPCTNIIFNEMKMKRESAKAFIKIAHRITKIRAMLVAAKCVAIMQQIY